MRSIDVRHVRHVGIVLVVALLGSVAGAEPRRFKFAHFGEIEADVPEGWNVLHSPEETTSIVFEPPGEEPLMVVLNPIPAVSTPEKVASSAARLLAHTKQQLQAIATDPDLQLREAVGEHCRVRYYSVTDRTVTAPTRQDTKYADEGTVEMGGVLAVFNILTNEKDTPDRAAGIEILRSLRYVPAAP